VPVIIDRVLRTGEGKTLRQLKRISDQVNSIEEDFAARGLCAMTARLDVLAASAEVVIGLSEAQSAYLRVLSRGSAQQTGALPRLLPVPMRLIERIGQEGLVRRVDPALLETALLWERAAVLSGRTMSEWAALALLEIAL